MNIAALLDYGPRLSSNVISVRAGQKAWKRYSPEMIARYKSYSIDGQIWSTRVTEIEKNQPATVAKNLKAMMDDGILINIGKYKESRASNKPVLYAWADEQEKAA